MYFPIFLQLFNNLYLINIINTLLHCINKMTPWVLLASRYQKRVNPHSDLVDLLNILLYDTLVIFAHEHNQYHPTINIYKHKSNIWIILIN